MKMTKTVKYSLIAVAVIGAGILAYNMFFKKETTELNALPPDVADEGIIEEEDQHTDINADRPVKSTTTIESTNQVQGLQLV